jgi:putative transposase
VRQLSTPLLFDGRLWEAEIQNTTALLRPEAGAPLTLPTEQFEHLLELGHIKQADWASPSPLQEAVRERLTLAGPKELEAANRRWREILAYSITSGKRRNRCMKRIGMPKRN